MTALRRPSLLPRGVSYADYLIRNCRVLQAIDRHGNCVKRVKLEPDVDEEVVWVWLEGLLERLDPDPIRHLWLMPAAPARSARTVEIMTALRVAALRSRPRGRAGP